jgi:selenide,water dikinase
VLDKVLGKLARQHDPNVLVGFDHADDAGVYQISPDTALVQTVDFFTPIVDDPYTFGQIAATNSLSDIYAMGGKPLTALALVCFPEKADLEILERILAGGLSKMVEAGCTIIGGHSIRDDETKFGYSVTGTLDPKNVLKNGGAQAGDRLLLTKAIGTGVISTAIKKGVAKQAWIDAAVKSMTTLNKTAAEVITSHVVGRRSSATDRVPHPSPFFGEGGEFDSRPGARSNTQDAPANDRRPYLACPEQVERVEGTKDGFPIHALTDVTGFGLIGHLREMLLASENVSAKLHASTIPLLEGALDCVLAGHIPAGLKANREFAECVLQYEDEIPDDLKTLLFDPQTAGGLLISVRQESAGELIHVLTSSGVPTSDIGTVMPRTKVLIEVAP